MIPLWNIQTADISSLATPLEALGYQQVLRQRAMALHLPSTPLPKPMSLPIENIHREADLIDWVHLNETAFGYAIDVKVIHRLTQDPRVTLFLYRLHGNPVAAALMFCHGGVGGIHLMGVPPHHQGRGYAKGMMTHLLHHATAQGVAYCTLQASAAGEPLYKQLGFQGSFVIHSYRKNIDALS